MTWDMLEVATWNTVKSTKQADSEIVIDHFPSWNWKEKNQETKMNIYRALTVRETLALLYGWHLNL